MQLNEILQTDTSKKNVPAFNAVGKKESCIFLVFIVFMVVGDVVLAGT